MIRAALDGKVTPGLIRVRCCGRFGECGPFSISVLVSTLVQVSNDEGAPSTRILGVLAPAILVRSHLGQLDTLKFRVQSTDFQVCAWEVQKFRLCCGETTTFENFLVHHDVQHQ